MNESNGNWEAQKKNLVFIGSLIVAVGSLMTCAFMMIHSMVYVPLKEEIKEVSHHIDTSHAELACQIDNTKAEVTKTRDDQAQITASLGMIKGRLGIVEIVK